MTQLPSHSRKNAQVVPLALRWHANVETTPIGVVSTHVFALGSPAAHPPGMPLKNELRSNMCGFILV